MVAFAYLSGNDPAEILGSARALTPVSVLLYFSNWVAVIRGDTSLGSLILTWSLSVEEQFYLLWALVLSVVLWRGRGRRGLLAILVTGVVLSGAISALMWRSHLARDGWERAVIRCYFSSDTRANEPLLGCIVGVLVSGRLIAPSRRTLAIAGPVCALVLAYFGSVDIHPWRGQTRAPWQDHFYFSGGNVVLGAMVGILIVALLNGQPPLLVRFFSFRPLVRLGRISYGVYLWHPSAFFLSQALVRPLLPGRRAPFVSGLALFVTESVAAIAFGEISHRLIEKPFLRLKHRFDPPAIRRAEPVAAAAARDAA
jgi:peptidoglycan/LPS O-acetylase OafA/YrhL